MSEVPQHIEGESGNTFALLNNRRLGAGTFGAVYAATDEAQATEDNVKYAVKLCARYVTSLKARCEQCLAANKMARLIPRRPQLQRRS